MEKQLRAEEIKALLLDYLIEDLDKDQVILANEVPYLSGLRKVDILKISKNDLHAFEIKSDLDTLRRLKPQITDYINTFDFTSIITTPKFKSKIFALVPNSVGLYLIQYDENMICVRQAKRRVRLNKNNLSYFLWKDEIMRELRKYRVNFNNESDTNTLRTLITNRLSAKELHSTVISYLMARYNDKYQNFLYERQRLTIIDDLKLLALKDNILLRY